MKCRKASLLGILCLGLLFWSGCLKTGKGQGEKLRDVEFTVVDEKKIPEELQTSIEKQKNEPFGCTYEEGENLYVAKGYGEQETSGYSIEVKACYLTEAGVVVDTELIGPEKGEEISQEKTTPYIILKLEKIEGPVSFQ